MFYPKCPECGSDKVTAAEPASAAEARQRGGMWLRAQALAGHPHPLMKTAYLGALIGHAVYQRYPGGGEKVCTSCGHSFR